MVADVSDGSVDGSTIAPDASVNTTRDGSVQSDAQPPFLDGGTTTSCAPAPLVGYTFDWHPPHPHTASCVGSDIADMYTACFDPKLQSAQNCSAFEAAHPACTACVMSKNTDPQYGALVSHSFTLRVFQGGCVADLLKDPSPGGCGARVEDAFQCADYSCRNCAPNVNDPSTFDAYVKCVDQARQTTCAKFQTVADQCVGKGPTAICTSQDFATSFKATAAAICGG
jgi:hypothetical protein